MSNLQKPNLLIFEWLCGGGLWMENQGTVENLLNEGKAMLTQFAGALIDSGRYHISTIRDSRIELDLDTKTHVVRKNELEKQLHVAAAAADHIFLIAPELGERAIWCCQTLSQFADKFVSPNETLIELASDKLRLAQHLESHNILTPQHLGFQNSNRWIRKPKLGTGGIEVELISNPPPAPKTCHAKIVEPFIEGLPISVLAIGGPQQTIILPSTEQLFRANSFEYFGSKFPLSEELQFRAKLLASQTISAIPKFTGIIGIDMVLGEFDVVIEVNARLTTSFLLLQKACQGNLADIAIQIAIGDQNELFSPIKIDFDQTPREFRVV